MANSLRIRITASFDSFGFSVCLATVFSLLSSLTVKDRLVHKIQSANRIRQIIGRIGKALTRLPSVAFKLGGVLCKVHLRPSDRIVRFAFKL